MAEVRLSVAARIDFDELIDYLAEAAGAAIAVKCAQRIRAQINLIADFPGVGAPRSKLGAATRMTSVSPYLIFYDGGGRRAGRSTCCASCTAIATSRRS